MCSERLKFPFDIKPLEFKLNAELLRYFHGERTGFIQVGPERYFFPHKYKAEAENFYNFEARPDDVWVVTFPRSGTTLTQELVWLVANNLDFESAAKKRLTERFPFFEFSCFMHEDVKAELIKENIQSPKNCKFIELISTPGYELLKKIPETQQRFIKSHLPFSLLPPSIMKQKSKLIYVARNPMDVAVSFYHLNRLFRTQGYQGDFIRYWDYFERGLNPWLPYYSHLKEAQTYKLEENILFLHYENMKKDMRGTINMVADFLGCHIATEGMDNLLNHLAIENFRLNDAVNMQEMDEIGILKKGEASFVRKGGDGIQKEFIDNPELYERAQNWMKLNEKKLKSYDDSH